MPAEANSNFDMHLRGTDGSLFELSEFYRDSLGTSQTQSHLLSTHRYDTFNANAGLALFRNNSHYSQSMLLLGVGVD